MSWLMLNKQGLRTLVHPNFAAPFNEVEEEEILDYTHRQTGLSATFSENFFVRWRIPLFSQNFFGGTNFPKLLCKVEGQNV